ncbi:monolysocardiolipin acyltransferase [Marchantia polymorpha subsp. ruderalis]|uniref:Phospholipid/glycerol acyltransferase domain-containing protein n=2 Tax=Marchantia polymorpha TaxID=3197 RepID=A0A176W9E1_MARPO|nr:hypothetical protein AXG93_509s1500 [Marchantia polymorpha subsp. ruderalis]PTQ49823.1 hypothetical protein MARPO_0002s0272 [Marchantia polymorpha]BBN00060.1 hypothetical protein Mp_1g26040 [Marchantia polymorpha subsp. ruderalis]|eukprot:PTQ49823.1 hypothetical protein MARPO_0002s0272 [Marchantia polymorpha]
MEDRGGLELGQQKITQLRANMRSLRERVRARFRVACVPKSLFRQSQRQTGVGWRATATGLVVARVFQGNIVLARVAKSMAQNEWQRRMRRLGNLLPDFRIFAGSVSTASVAQSQASCSDVLVTSLDSRNSNSKLQAEYGDYEVSLSLYGGLPNYEASILTPGVVTEVAEDSRLLRLMQALAIPLIGNACHIFMHGFNSTEVYGAEKMQNAVFNRAPGQPLITVSNHAAAVDDPFVISSILAPHKLLNSKHLRWTLCASDKCFGNAATSAFFRSVKVLPLTKGHGVFQEGMEVALSKLNRGDWVHIFPEGSRSRDGNLALFKRGVGRLVLDAKSLPLVVPFIHSGMEDVMPIGQKHFSMGKKVTVIVGDPIELDDLVQKHSEEGLPKAVLYDAIALRIEKRMWTMKKELDELVATNRSRDSRMKVHMVENVDGIWQYVDWEAQGFLSNESDSERRSRFSMSGVTQGTSVKFSDVTHRTEEDIEANKLEPEPVNTKHYPESESEVTLTDIYHGAVKRIQGHMDPSMLMGFAARSFLRYGPRFQDVEDSRSWKCWRRLGLAVDRALYSS